MQTKMRKYILRFIFISTYFTVSHQKLPSNNLIDIVKQRSPNVTSAKTYVSWPNATVPFYVNPEHYDHEQSLAILTALSRFAFVTCLKFAPVMTAPLANEHVLVFENERGVRRCVFDTRPHSVFEPHRVTLGYKCLQSPQIDAALMRALGFPFEHNHVDRDNYIDILLENVESGASDLFIRDAFVPIELNALSYDVNSVTHFGTRDFSRNGHRTILFKDPTVKQNRIELTNTDLRKIEIVYGAECRARDRQEKIDLCQSYPGVARRKRDVDIEYHSTDKEQYRRKRDLIGKSEIRVKRHMSSKLHRKKRDLDEVTKSLRINPDIKPPPNASDVSNTLKELGIESAVQEIVDQVNKVTALALKNAREKYCNDKQAILRSVDDEIKPDSDILGIIEFIANYAQGMVENAVGNLTQFCEESQSIDIYQRARCSWNDGSDRCRQTYKSTNFGPVRHSTNHRPIIAQPTRHHYEKKNIYARAGNDTETTSERMRRKRETDNTKEKTESVANEKEVVKNDNHDQGETEINVDKKGSDLEKKIKSQEKAGDKNDDVQVKIEEKDGKEDMALRSRTFLPGMNRYQAVRRSQSSRDRARIEDDSSVSIEAERPRKRKRSRRTTEERPTTREIKRNRKRKVIVEDEDDGTNEKREMKRNRKRKEIAEVEDEDDGINENRHTSKRPRQGQQGFVPKVVKLSTENEEFYKERKWPGGLVAYMIQEDTTYDTDNLRQRIEEVNSILKRKTCVRLKEITEEKAENYEDYVVIDNSPDYITGRVGGRQKFGSIELFRGDQHRQHTAMMVMAMLGFYFEVARHDRDRHVRVHLRHVRPDKLHHFEKIRSDATLPLPYDYQSATHPAWQFWRQLGRTGISTVATFKQQDPEGTVMKLLGQNAKLLSDLDIVKINSVYGIKCFQNEKSDRKSFGQYPNKKKNQGRIENRP